MDRYDPLKNPKSYKDALWIVFNLLDHEDLGLIPIEIDLNNE